MCPNCHSQLDHGSLREFEFEIVLADLMQASPLYVDVKLEAPTMTADPNRGPADITAKSANGAQAVIVECKSSQTIGTERLRAAINQLRHYGDPAASPRLVLAIAARVTPAQRAIAESEGVEVWDLDGIASQFRDQLEGVTHPVLRSLLLGVAALNASKTATPEEQLLTELRALAPGRAGWNAYQKLVGRILERLFCPPLSTPVVNHADDLDINRRDIILPNYADGGFWLFLRERYAADYLVVDAKNYTECVSKSEALQVLNYLKRHGAGQLGMIVTRAGADHACMSTVREHWAHSEKLLIILSDDHIERMLRAKEAGGPPEDVVRQWIEEFRLSM